MSENPYEAPASDFERQAVGVLSCTRADLRSVAVYQKCILVCILINLSLIVGQLALPPEYRLLAAIPSVITSIVSTVFVFLLAIKVYSVVQGVIFGILAFVPCLGLIVLLIINSKATKILKDNGIKVGLLGANLSKI